MYNYSHYYSLLVAGLYVLTCCHFGSFDDHFLVAAEVAVFWQQPFELCSFWGGTWAGNIETESWYNYTNIPINLAYHSNAVRTFNVMILIFQLILFAIQIHYYTLLYTIREIMIYTTNYYYSFIHQLILLSFKCSKLSNDWSQYTYRGWLVWRASSGLPPCPGLAGGWLWTAGKPSCHYDWSLFCQPCVSRPSGFWTLFHDVSSGLQTFQEIIMSTGQ